MSDEERKPPARGGFTLDGRPVEDALPENWGRPERREGRIGEWGGSSPRHSPKKDGAESYIGGEKSGLAVQNPDQGRGEGGEEGIVSDILRQAASHGPAEEPRPQHPWGRLGHTLGSDEVDSVQVGEGEEEHGETQTRTLTFWADGFSIEDGPLHAYDAPGNRELLQAIQAGRAPMSLFDVRFDQPLQIVVQQRTGEKYAPPPKVFRSFGGEGNRLGSITPEISGANTPVNATSPVPGSFSSFPSAASAAPSASKQDAKIEVDASKPTTNVQVRLADGSRLVVRVNLTHTVGDLRNYIDAARPTDREYILQTTFPPRELPDNETVEQAKLQNAVVIQRLK
ncbi:SEP-domain-containing protein [Cutaneotrichosporon oleaginosum]|uniref:SEP-domain-containing protein n=1 Tax=Cutaneotrichosporon oleaginosum TaxID=879819 RepID=A0A0J0XY36_9TREE|nr:SEP-domain-containing protein [Cutaneotrichosporon oleaginosum]KLT45953.1 SEP-domain-containing protein [Cutaneotrichosporon oleaginosum]